MAFQGKSFLLEFNASLVGKANMQRVRKNGLQYVETAWFSAKPPRVRVHLKFATAVKPVVKAIEGGWVAQIGGKPESTLLAPKVAEQPADRLPMAPKPKDPIFKPFEAKPEPLTPRRTPPQPAPNPAAPAQLISLDFSGTEIAQVLKAVAMQANVNIVTAPEVKGQVTVSLEKVTVEDALDVLTAVANLSYSKIGSTYMVVPKGQNAGMGARMGGETRVAPIYSGEAAQVRAAATRILPPHSSVEILAPGAADAATPTPTPAPATSEGTPAGAGAPPTPTSTASAGAQRAQLYLVVVGPRAELDHALSIIRQIDEAICDAYGIEIPDSAALVRDTYRLQSDTLSAEALVKMVGGLEGTAFRGVELYASPKESDLQSVVVVGRSTEVERAKEMLAEFDVSGNDIFIYEVRYSDPRALREQVVAAVPGLSATIPAAPATNPRVYQPGVARTAAAEGERTDGASGSRGSGESAPDAAVRGGAAEATGLTQPFNAIERVAAPMRLILRGSQVQIEQARQFLKQVDVAPKQVALDLRVMEISKEDALRVGLDWSIVTGGVVRALRVNNTLGDTAATGGTISGDFSNNASGRTTGSVLATLDQIASSRNLIARPNVIAVDGRETELFVGDVIRYIESIQSSQNGVTVTVGTVRVGVRLAVMARVGAKDNVALDLRPVLSFLRGYTPVPGGGQLPQTSERMVQSTANVRNGDTIAIGGLIRDEDRKTHSGIPFLKDIPILGRLLFSRTDNSRVRTEIVFFLTVKVVDPEDDGTAASPLHNEQRNDGLPPVPKPEPAK